MRTITSAIDTRPSFQRGLEPRLALSQLKTEAEFNWGGRRVVMCAANFLAVPNYCVVHTPYYVRVHHSRCLYCTCTNVITSLFYNIWGGEVHPCPPPQMKPCQRRLELTGSCLRTCYLTKSRSVCKAATTLLCQFINSFQVSPLSPCNVTQQI